MPKKTTKPEVQETQGKQVEGKFQDVIDKIRDASGKVNWAVFFALLRELFSVMPKEKAVKGGEIWDRPDGMKGASPETCLHTVLHHLLEATAVVVNHIHEEEETAEEDGEEEDGENVDEG